MSDRVGPADELSLQALAGQILRCASASPDRSELSDRFRELFLAGRSAFYRDYFNPGHFTGSALILSPDRSEVALVHHRKINRWLQPGGHADGDIDLLRVAEREAMEETGLTDISSEGSLPIDIDIHYIPPAGTEPEHLHYDVRYCFISRSRLLQFDPRESLGARWFSRAEIEVGEFEVSLKRLVLAANSL